MPVGAVIVLHAAFPGHFAGFEPDVLLPRLPYAKRLELERREPHAREAALAGITLALEAFRRLRLAPPPVSDLRFPQHGKPAFAGGPFFSISHTDGRVACAATEDFECGFDFEFVPVGADEAMRARLSRWTAAEAVLKAAGLGLRDAGEVELSADLSTGRVHGRHCHLSAIDLGPSHAAHLATLGPPGEIRIEEVREAPAAPAR